MQRLFAFLSRLPATRQIDWLSRQPDELLTKIDQRWGYGASECRCPIDWAPCPEHTLTRFATIARIATIPGDLDRRQGQTVYVLHHGRAGVAIPWQGTLLASLAVLSDRRLFWTLFPEFHGKKACDCGPVCVRCPHADGDFQTPLAPEAVAFLLHHLHAADLAEPPTPLDESDCGTTRAKAYAMAFRNREGFALTHPRDLLRRDTLPLEGVRRMAATLRNGALATTSATMAKGIA